MASVWYPLECILVPCMIGTLMYLGFDVWDRRRRRHAKDELPIIDYLI